MSTRLNADRDRLLRLSKAVDTTAFTRDEQIPPAGEQGLRRPEQLDLNFTGPWFNAKTAAVYVCCKNVKSWYEWRKSHGIVPRNNGSVAKADLDRALKLRKPARVMAKASLDNLKKRRVIA
jgi:hypothetical protein